MAIIVQHHTPYYFFTLNIDLSLFYSYEIVNSIIIKNVELFYCIKEFFYKKKNLIKMSK